MSFFTVFAFVIFWFYGSKGKQFYKAAGDGLFFSKYQVPSARSAADAQDGSLNDDLF